MKQIINISQKTKFLLAAILLSIISSATFILVTIKVWQTSDYPTHIEHTIELSKSGLVDFSHTAFHQLTIITRAIIPFSMLQFLGKTFSETLPEYSFQIAGLIVVVLFNLALVLLIFDRIKKENARLPTTLLLLLCFFIPLFLVVVAPVSIFTVFQHNLYLGYIGINVYHNPTIILLKTASILLFWMILDNYSKKKAPLVTILGLILLTTFDLLAKPSFVLCFLPVICLKVVISLIRKQLINWKLIVFGFIFPSFVILLFQYLQMYSLGQQGGIAFSFLEIVQKYVPTIGGIFTRLVLSLIFPITFFALNFKKILRDHRLSTVYGGLLIGLFLMYIPVELGARAGHANFWWSTQIALFVLFVETTLYCLRQIPTTGVKILFSSIRFWILSAAFALHLASGIAWYWAEVLRPSKFW